MGEDPERSADTSGGSGGAGASTPPVVEVQLAAAIVDATRTLARTVPPPRGAPFFYLDTDAAYDLRVFDSLSARGIFRKYEFALDIGSGLGGRARWLAARTGCSIVGVDPSVAAITAATMLNRRAHMDTQVRFQVAHPEHLPVRACVFTHVWMLDVACDATIPTRLAEAFRVLRRGGHFAMQCPVLSAAHRAELLAMLTAVGFVEVETREVMLAEPPDGRRMAIDRLRAVLRPHPDAALLLSRLPSSRREASRMQVFAARLT